MPDELYREVMHAECAVLKAAKAWFLARRDDQAATDDLEEAINRLIAAERAYKEENGEDA